MPHLYPERAQGCYVKLAAWTTQIVETNDLDVLFGLDQFACNRAAHESADPGDKNSHNKRVNGGLWQLA